MKVAIIGGGAAGFFSAISVKEHNPSAHVVIFEKSKSVLSKVKISGGGRCNLTNGCHSISDFSKAYPRGEKLLKKAFHIFNNKHTIDWFESRGVPLVVEEDLCIFPKSQSSQTIIDCLIKETRKHNMEIEKGAGVIALKKTGLQIELKFENKEYIPRQFDKVIVTTGGSPEINGLKWLESINHKIESPVPSLFTFNIPNNPVKKLMGIVNEKTIVSIQGTKFRYMGPLLITHWGMSGPVILKLSSYAARYLSEVKYDFKIQVNWVNESNSNLVVENVIAIAKEHPQKLLPNVRPFYISERLWLFLLEKVDLPLTKKWGEIGNKGVNKLVNILTNDEYRVKGQTTFREEFVTCGGVSLESVDYNTLQSNVFPNLYFAGEVLDIDGITGGFNLQAAWTTGFIAGKLL